MNVIQLLLIIKKYISYHLPLPSLPLHISSNSLTFCYTKYLYGLLSLGGEIGYQSCSNRIQYLSFDNNCNLKQCK